jgi:ABC-type amino acid transport substrate-binding protein
LAVPKNGLAPAVLAALKVVMQNGTYSGILSHWGLTSGAIPAAQVKINGAIS